MHPSVPDHNNPDFTSPGGLRQALIALNTHNAWATRSVSADLIVDATTSYTQIVRVWHRDPVDCGYEVYLAGRPVRRVEQTIDSISHRITSLFSGGSAVDILERLIFVCPERRIAVSGHGSFGAGIRERFYASVDDRSGAEDFSLMLP